MGIGSQTGVWISEVRISEATLYFITMTDWLICDTGSQIHLHQIVRQNEGRTQEIAKHLNNSTYHKYNSRHRCESVNLYHT